MDIERKALQVLPPPPGHCRLCAVKHDDSQPHDATSLYYQVLFAQGWGRSPTWADAMSHCDDETKAAWTQYLNRIGIDVNSTAVGGGITSNAELEERLKRVDGEVGGDI